MNNRYFFEVSNDINITPQENSIFACFTRDITYGFDGKNKRPKNTINTGENGVILM